MLFGCFLEVYKFWKLISLKCFILASQEVRENQSSLVHSIIWKMNGNCNTAENLNPSGK